MCKLGKLLKLAVSVDSESLQPDRIMSATFSDRLVTDDLTVLLGLVAATVFLLNNLYKPQPLVHPILLGRQSDVGRARFPGESAIYRNYSTGLMGRVCLDHAVKYDTY